MQKCHAIGHVTMKDRLCLNCTEVNDMIRELMKRYDKLTVELFIKSWR